MAGPEDRDSGAKPPQPPPADTGWLPPRLRDKLEASKDQPTEPPKKSPAGLIVGLVVIVALVIVGWWFIHNQQVKAKAEAARVAAREKAVADSTAAVRTADSLAVVARADSIAAFNKLPRSKQRQILIQQARAAGGTALADLEKAEGPYVIDAGEFMFEDKARTEAEALKTSTKLAARVAKVGGTYHIYLGRFETRAPAERAAADLAAKGLVQEASVVATPGK